MFLVKSVEHGECRCCAKTSECYTVECQQKTVVGLLCPRCLTRLLKMRMPLSPGDATPASGDRSALQVPKLPL